MFELAIIVSLAAIIAAAWFFYKDREADADNKRIQGKLTNLEKSVKRLSEELKDV